MQPASHSQTAILIATLGTEAQVVTAALDLLLARGEPIGEVWAVHTDSREPGIRLAVERLKAAFEDPAEDDTHRIGSVPLSLLPIFDEQGRLVDDVDTPASAQAAFRFIYRQVRRAKLAGFRIHLAVAGGRKPLALFAISTAQLLCDEGDSLWYLVSGGEFLASKRLHPAPGDYVQLLAVPFIRWSRVSPVWTAPGAADDPFEAAARVERIQLGERLEAARSFILGVLTPAERRIVEPIVVEGMTSAEVAARQFLSPRTVEQHLRSVYRKAADHWEMEEMNRAQLIALLSLYYQFAETQIGR